MVSLTYRTQDLVKIDNESFELEHIFKCDRNILVLPHQFTKSVLGKVKRLTSVRQWSDVKRKRPRPMLNDVGLLKSFANDCVSKT